MGAANLKTDFNNFNLSYMHSFNMYNFAGFNLQYKQ